MAYDVGVLNERAVSYAQDVVRSTTAAGSGHASTALSLVHIVSCLMEFMKINPKNSFAREENDVLVLSEGHAVPVIYSAWQREGVKVLKDGVLVDVPDVTSLRELQSVFDGHPNPVLDIDSGQYRLPFACATGALGQGLSVANGIALADRLDNIKRRIFVIAGDSEVREGQYDESARFAVAKRLPVRVILNSNKFGQSGRVEDMIPYDYRKEFEAKGWDVVGVNGNDVENVMKGLEAIDGLRGPAVMIADTVKGWGVSDLQQGNWHGKPLPKNLESKALAELESRRAHVAVPVKCGTEHVLSAEPRNQLVFPPSPLGEKTSARKAYGMALAGLGDMDTNVVVLDAEVSNSTFSDIFGRKFPERFFECGVAEQNMASVAAGLASQGKTVFVNSFARFLETAYSQLSIAFQSRLPLHVVGSHVGLGAHSDGPSQMALADVAYMLAFPNVVVFSPSDGMSAYKLTQVCANSSRPTYMRTFRPDMPVLYGDDEQFKVGGSKVLREGEDVTLVSHGFMTHIVLAAADILQKENITCSVVDAYGLAPFDPSTVLEESRRTDGKVLVVEDNFRGGLGSVIVSVVDPEPMYVHQMFVSRWPKSARSMEDLLKYCGLSVDDIVDRARKMANDY
ncbi:transketolase [Candidatus Woesearchaeota archaeon]|nr:transketolase [Candidatus Woesearchaeota archaeon]